MTPGEIGSRGGEGEWAGSDLPIRPPRTSDRPAILDLLRQTVGETSASRKTEAFWVWKHVEGAFGPSYSICAWDDGSAEPRIVGLRTLMWWEFVDPSGSTQRAARAVDTATHPDYQRRGIFSRLTRRAIEDLRDEGAAFIFNTPNDQSLPGYLKMGWTRVARWPVYVRPVRWLPTARALLGGSTPRSHAPRGSSFTSWSQFREDDPDGVNAVISVHERLRPTVGYRTPRTLSYLDWRFGKHPDITYYVHAIREGTELSGFAICRPVPGAKGLRALVITELFVRAPTASACRRLLSSLMRATSCDYVMAHFAPGTVERRALTRCGFVRAPKRGYTFVALPLGNIAFDPRIADSWDLTLSELEIF
jgi:GNAT superfamily N-acetyltransferase